MVDKVNTVIDPETEEIVNSPDNLAPKMDNEQTIAVENAGAESIADNVSPEDLTQNPIAGDTTGSLDVLPQDIKEQTGLMQEGTQLAEAEISGGKAAIPVTEATNDPFGPSRISRGLERQAEFENEDGFKSDQLAKDLGFDEGSLQEQELAALEVDDSGSDFQNVVEEGLKKSLLTSNKVKQKAAETDPKEGESDFNLIEQAALGSAQGVLTAFNEVGNIIPDLVNGANDLLGALGYTEGSKILDTPDLLDAVIKKIPDDGGGAQEIIKEIVRFGLGYAAITKGVSSLKTGARAARALKIGASGLVQFATADPDDKNIFEVIGKHFELEDTFLGFISNEKEDESRLVRRFKSGLADIILGGATEAGIALSGPVLKVVNKAIDLTADALRHTRRTAVLKKTINEVSDASPKGFTAIGEDDVIKEVASFDQINKKITDARKQIKAEKAAINKTLREGSKKRGRALLDSKGNVRLEGVETAADVKDLIDLEVDAIGTKLAKAKKGATTVAELEELAGKLNLTKEELLQKDPEVISNAVRVLAEGRLVKKLSIQMGEEIDAAKKLLDKNELTKAGINNLRDRWEQTATIFSRFQEGGSETGRALRIRQEIFKGDDSEKAQFIFNKFKAFGDEGDSEAFINMMFGQSPDLIGNTLLSRGQKLFSNWTDTGIYLMKNNLISSPRTVMGALLSSTHALITQIPERLVGEKVSKVLGTVDGVVEGEAAIMSKQILKTTMDVFESAKDFAKASDKVARVKKGTKETFLGELGDTAGTKFADISSSGIKADQLGLGDGVLAKAFDGAVSFMGTSGRLLMKADHFIGAHARQMQLDTLIHRELTSNPIYKNLTKTEKVSLATKFSQHPEKHVKHLLKQAEDFANVVKMTKDLKGFPAAIESAINSNPFTRAMFPFAKTGLNALEFNVKRIPLLGQALFYKDTMAAIAKGGASRDMEIAKFGLYSGYTMVFTGLGFMGLATGDGPQSNSSRQILKTAKVSRNSIKAGDTYVSLERLEGVSSIFSMGADLGMMASDMYANGQAKEYQGLAAGLTMLMMKHLTPEYMMDTSADLIKFVKGGVSEERFNRFVAEQVAKLAVPNVLRDVRRAIDPVSRDVSPDVSEASKKRDDLFRDSSLLKTVINEIKNGLPFWSKSLPPQVDLLNREQPFVPSLGFDFLSPIKASIESDSPVAKEFLRLDIADSVVSSKLKSGFQHLKLLQPEDTITINGLEKKLSPQEHHVLKVLTSGNNIEYNGVVLKNKIRGKTFEQTVQEALDKNWKVPGARAGRDGTVTDNMKRIWINEQHNAFMKRAKFEFLKVYDNLKEDLRNYRIEGKRAIGL